MQSKTNHSKRIAWLDIAKGILILCIIMGHCSSPFGNLVYTFHIPAFFFFAGYTAHFDRKHYIGRRFLTRVVPFYALNTLFIIALAALGKLLPSVYHLFYAEKIDWVEKIGTLAVYSGGIDLTGALWFVLALFWCEVIAKLLYELCRWLHTQKWHLPLCIAVGFGGYFVTQMELLYRPYTFNFDLGLFALFFYALGTLCGGKKVFENTDPDIMTPLCAVLVWFVAYLTSNKNNWPTREFGSIVFMIVGALSGVYLVYVLAKEMEGLDHRVMISIGQSSFALMSLHFLAFRLVSTVLFLLKVVDISALSTFPAASGKGLWIGYLIGTVVLITPLSMLARKNVVTNLLINGEWRRKAK